MNFDEAFTRLIGNEGGYTNNQADPGGETNWGISKRAYPDVEIASLTMDQAKALYLRDFWNPLADANPAIKFQAFDFAVNAGMSTAIRKLQSAIGVADDGHWGPASAGTLAQQDVNDVLMLFAAERLNFYTGLTKWDTFGKGWARRIANDLKLAAQDN